MNRDQLETVRSWANEKLATGQEPPWAWYQYMKLRETLDAILAGMSVTTTESLQQSAPHQEKHLRLVDSTYQRDTAQHRPSDETVKMPM